MLLARPRPVRRRLIRLQLDPARLASPSLALRLPVRHQCDVRRPRQLRGTK